MDGDFPWHYLALVVIAFVSWLFQKIQEATAERKRANELRRRQRDGMETAPLPQPSLPRRELPVPPVVDEHLRELIEALGGPPQPVAPPPLPPEKKPKPVAAKAVKPAEPPKTPVPVPRVQPVLTAPAEVSHREPNPLRKLLSSPAGLRQALVLKEILDKPVTLR
jgi:hypothetical protein